MKKIIVLTLLITAWHVALLAQCESFNVYRIKGDIKFVRGSESWTPAKNTPLARDLTLQVGNDANIILLSGQDKALRIATAGTYPYIKVKTICEQNQTSLTKEYLNYVAQSILEKEEPKTAMVIKGAVYRSKAEFGSALPMVEPSDSSVITGEEITFAWHRPADSSARYLHIYENGVKRVYSRRLSDTTVTVFSGLFKAQKIYFWLVSANKEPSDSEPRFTFVNAPKDWRMEMLSDTTGFMRDLEGDLDVIQLKMKTEEEKK